MKHFICEEYTEVPLTINRKATGSHRQAKFFELKFFIYIIWEKASSRLSNQTGN